MNSASFTSQPQQQQQRRQPDEHPNYDESCMSSRRSVDWRDSGIVIDEDLLTFPSEAAIFQSAKNFEQKPLTSTGCCPSEKIALDQDDDGDTLLHLAVVGCPLDKVNDLIRIYDLNAINNMMHTPLHVSVMANRPEVAKLLLGLGAKLDIQDRRGNTPLHMACQKGHREIVTILLEHIKSFVEGQPNNTSIGQYIEMANFDGQTCLHLAALNNHIDILNVLVNVYEANVNCHESKSGATVLHNAIAKLNLDLVQKILDLKQHCNESDFSGLRPLDTIYVLRKSRIDQSQADILSRIEEVIRNRIEACRQFDGCCVNLRTIEERTTNDGAVSEQSSTSSSEYSDSELSE